MARFYVPEPKIEAGILRIEGDEVKHIRRVLRLKVGDEISIFDGSGKVYEGTIVEEGPLSVAVKVQAVVPSEGESRLEIILAQSLLKGEKMDYLIQKATELGVREIIPFYSSRSIPVLERPKGLERHRRWERIAIEASKQCGRGVLPQIDLLKDYPEMLRSASADCLRLILWEREGVRLKKILGETGKKARVFFVVGPEGGLSQAEVADARAKGFVPATLGKRILRAETASLCFLSILQYEWGDIG